MLACWSRECEDRPSFQTLSEELFDMQREEQPYVNVDPSQDFILPPTAGRGMKQHDEIDEYIVNGIINVNCIFGENLLNARLHLLYHSFLLTNLFFSISDTVGNLIAFSDGTFSGETADHDEVEMEELPNKLVSIISMATAPEL